MSWLFKDPVTIMKEIMSWLFKNPIVTVAWLNFYQSNIKDPMLTVAWLNFDQSGIKKWPIKIKFPQMRLFLKKATNKIFMYLLIPFILQN